MVAAGVITEYAESDADADKEDVEADADADKEETDADADESGNFNFKSVCFSVLATFKFRSAILLQIWVGGFRFQMFPLPLLISPRLKTPISSERVGSDFEWVPSSPRSPFNCNLREPLPSASSAAASACPFYFVNNNRIGNISSSFGSGGCVDAVSAAIETLENDPCTNAGRGSNLTEDVHVECDASVMDGKSGTFGAVGAVPEKLCNGDKWTSQAGAKWTKIHPQQQQPNKRESDNSSSTAAAQGQNGQKQPPRMSSKNRKEPNNSSNTAGPPSTQDRGRKAKNYLQKLPPFL
ncbi:hypothetical protein LXL04_006453 [Taraxacum kok-saghyz]